MTIRFGEENTFMMAAEIISAVVGPWSLESEQRGLTVDEIEHIAEALMLWVKQQREKEG